MQEIILKVRYFERGLSKSYKKGNFPFSFKLSPFQNYQKQKGPGTNDQGLYRLRSKTRKTALLVIYCLTKFDDVV